MTKVTIEFPNEESAQKFFRWVKDNEAEFLMTVDEDFYFEWEPVQNTRAGYIRFRPKPSKSSSLYRVEFDLAYYGGDYKDVGNFVGIVVKEHQSVEHAFEKVTGYDRCHIVHYKRVEDDSEDEE